MGTINSPDASHKMFAPPLATAWPTRLPKAIRHFYSETGGVCLISIFQKQKASVSALSGLGYLFLISSVANGGPRDSQPVFPSWSSLPSLLGAFIIISSFAAMLAPCTARARVAKTQGKRGGQDQERYCWQTCWSTKRHELVRFLRGESHETNFIRGHFSTL